MLAANYGRGRVGSIAIMRRSRSASRKNVFACFMEALRQTRQREAKRIIKQYSSKP